MPIEPNIGNYVKLAIKSSSQSHYSFLKLVEKLFTAFYRGEAK